MELKEKICPKGIDDLFAVGEEPEILDGEKLNEFLSEIEQLSITPKEKEYKEALEQFEKLEPEIKASPELVFSDAVCKILVIIQDYDNQKWLMIKQKLRSIKELSTRSLEKGIKAYRKKNVAADKEKNTKNSESPYVYLEDSTYLVKHNKETQEKVLIEISNFTAFVVGEFSYQDGVSKILKYEISGKTASGKQLSPIKVLSSEFEDLAWVSLWGAEPHWNAKMKEHLRTAIHKHSGSNIPRIDIFTHTGWIQYERNWYYLTSSGALGKDGYNDSIKVELGALSDISFNCRQEFEIKKLLKDLLRFLDIAPDHISFPLFIAPFRAILNEACVVNFAILLQGVSGTMKSSITALIQAFFGSSFNYKHLIFNWESTDNSLESQLFLAKDIVAVIDDFSPKEGAKSREVAQNKADRIIRGQGNKSGRQRMNSKAEIIPIKNSRGLIVSSGEDVPKGQSLRSRALILSLQEGMINKPILSEFQTLAERGLLTQITKSFIQYVAPNMCELKRAMPEEIQNLRKEFCASHLRTTDIAADLHTCFVQIMRFYYRLKVLTEEEARILIARSKSALLESVAQQSTFQIQEEPCSMFLRLLSSVFIGCHAHAKFANENGYPENPDKWGWKGQSYTRERPLLDGSDKTVTIEVSEWNACGPVIGWIEDNELFLDPDGAWTAVVNFNKKENPISISQNRLWQSFAEKGYIFINEKERKTRLRRVINGQSIYVIVFKNKNVVLNPEDNKVVNNGPKDDFLF